MCRPYLRHRRLAEGENIEDTEAVAAGAPERAGAAFGLVGKGLRGYAVKEWSQLFGGSRVTATLRKSDLPTADVHGVVGGRAHP